MTWQEMRKRLLEDFDAQVAYEETRIREAVARHLKDLLYRHNVSVHDFLDESQLEIEQAERLLHNDIGGDLSLNTLVRAAKVLGLRLTIGLQPK